MTCSDKTMNLEDLKKHLSNKVESNDTYALEYARLLSDILLTEARIELDRKSLHGVSLSYNDIRSQTLEEFIESLPDLPHGEMNQLYFNFTDGARYYRNRVIDWYKKGQG